MKSSKHSEHKPAAKYAARSWHAIIIRAREGGEDGARRRQERQQRRQKAKRQMTEPKYFGRLKGGISLHCEDVEGTSVRFILGRFGEDPTKLIDAFWKEQTGDFEIVPLFGYGNAPRPELCTARSLAAALQTATIDPGSRTEQQWKRVCEQHNVAWPTRLQPKQTKAA